MDDTANLDTGAADAAGNPPEATTTAEPSTTDLTLQLDAANARADEAFSKLAAMTNERDALQAAASNAAPDLSADLAAATTRGDALQAALDAMTKERDALKAAAEKAANAAKVDAAPKPAKRRKLVANGIPDLEPAELLAAIGAAEKVELAFGDGTAEIAGMAPLAISGNAWTLRAAGLLLTASGASATAPADRNAEIAGYGLFLDGKLAAYSPRFEVLRVPAGQTHTLDNEVVFPG